MSKRSGTKAQTFIRNARDFYATPEEAVFPLLAYLPDRIKFVEPCAGDGRLIRHLSKQGHSCVYACDLAPQPSGPIAIEQRDVLFFERPIWPSCDYFITNPPWTRELLHPMIDLFRRQRPTWLLMDAAWKYTGQAKPYLAFCDLIVNVGRISWMGNGTASMDDCNWYRFIDQETDTIFKT